MEELSRYQRRNGCVFQNMANLPTGIGYITLY